MTYLLVHFRLNILFKKNIYLFPRVSHCLNHFLSSFVYLIDLFICSYFNRMFWAISRKYSNSSNYIFKQRVVTAPRAAFNVGCYWCILHYEPSQDFPRAHLPCHSLSIVSRSSTFCS